jgi:uncharacterized protein (TIGR02266 family)
MRTADDSSFCFAAGRLIARGWRYLLPGATVARRSDMRDECAGEHPYRPERPTVERAHIEVEVSLTTESQFFAGLNGDISTGGLFVQTYEIRPVGSRVLLDILLPTAQIVTTGVVRWVRHATEGTLPGLGYGLDLLSSSERSAIESFCLGRPALYHELGAD